MEMTMTTTATIQDVFTRADNANTPYHTSEVSAWDNTLHICVRGIEDSTAAHVTTLRALSAVGDAIGIPAKLWIKGKGQHSGTFASRSFPLDEVLAAIDEQQNDDS